MTAIVVQGDARHLQLPDDSVDLIVTSPPYFGLRSYTDGGEHYATQIGSEATPQEFVAALVECTREMMRVLKPSGSIFVNLGDKYGGQGGGAQGSSSARKGRTNAAEQHRGGHTGTTPKSLMLLPERYRIACTDELGLIARAVIVWSKPNGLPESVRDRVRRSHEDWVHLTLGPKYFEAVDEIREPIQDRGAALTWQGRKDRGDPVRYGEQRISTDRAGLGGNPLGKLPGSVWSIATQPLRVPAELNVDHFAAFPMEWPRRLITGWCPREVCTACGEGRRPSKDGGAWVFAPPGEDMARRALAKAEALGITAQEVVTVYGREAIGHGADRSAGDHQIARDRDRVESDALAHRLGSATYARNLRGRLRQLSTGYACACPDTSAPSTPGVVLDPFGGTGTTALMADVLGRVGISLDASADYCRIAQWRTTDPKQRERAGRGLPRDDGQLQLEAA